MKNLKTIIFLLVFLFLNGCGFKVLDQSQLKNYKIIEINENGDKKINFFIKNKLYNLLNKDNSVNILIININSRKNKSIKEKNKKNQITKYKINIDSEIELNFVNDNIVKKINISKQSFYNVNKNHNITLNNKKNVEKNLTDKISLDLSNEILKIANEL